MLFPSVTTVIDPWADWSKIPPDILQYACDRGTEVDRLCGCIVREEFAIVSPECQPYIDSFLKWYDLLVEKTILDHERLAHPVWRYHGELDIFCQLKDGRNALIDLKTPVALKKAWRLQLSGYRELLIADGYRVDCAGSLRLSPTGKMARLDWYDNTAEDFNYFIMALKLHEYLAN
jgi:hypothetical protein